MIKLEKDTIQTRIDDIKNEIFNLKLCIKRNNKENKSFRIELNKNKEKLTKLNLLIKTK